MTINLKQLETALNDLSKLPIEARQHVLWDLETSHSNSIVEDAVAMLIVGLKTGIKPEQIQAVLTIFFHLEKQFSIPAPIKSLAMGLIATASGYGRMSEAGRFALIECLRTFPGSKAQIEPYINLTAIDPVRLADNLIEKITREPEGGVQVPALLWEYTSEKTKLVAKISDLMNRGDLGAALSAAAEPSGLKSFIQTVIEQDYRIYSRFVRAGSINDDPVIQLVCWLFYAAYRKSETAGKIRTPSQVKKTISRSTAQDIRALVDTAVILESLESGNSSESISLVFSPGFLETLKRTPLFLHELLVLVALKGICARVNQNSLEHWALMQYQSLCRGASFGLCGDIMQLGAGEIMTRQPELPIIGESRQEAFLPRKGSMARSTIKVLVRLAAIKFQKLLHSDRAEAKRLATSALRQYVGELKDLKGGIQKIVQLGLPVGEVLPFEVRDMVADQQHGVVAQTVLPYATVLDIVERTYDRKYSEIFAAVSETPAAMGSTAQVHQATLISGQTVALKIRLPGIETVIRKDFRNLRAAAFLFKALLPKQKVNQIFTVWEEMILRGCNYENEARICQKAGQIISGTDVTVARVFDEYTRPNILVSEWIDGESLLDVARDGSQATRSHIGRQIWTSQYQLLRGGIFRADIHAGNFLVRDGQLVLIDLGEYEEGSQLAGSHHLDMMAAIARGDEDFLIDIFIRDGWCEPEHAPRAAELTLNLIGRPFKGEFEFTEAYVREVFIGTSKNLGSMLSVPPAHRAARIFWSLFSLLALLRSKSNWKEVLELEGNVPGKRSA